MRAECRVGFVLGQGMMLPDFETAVEGLKAGETKTFDLTFPEAWPTAHARCGMARRMTALISTHEGCVRLP